MFHSTRRNRAWFFRRCFLSLMALAFLFFYPLPARGLASPGSFQSGDLVLQSEKVCSPGTHNKCGPGPFTKTVTAPAGVSGVRVDVYWLSTGQASQNQPNEQSYFIGSGGLGQVYCQDFGFSDVTPIFCGSASTEVTSGQTIELTILHADDVSGPTPGSHRQVWAVTWVSSPGPSASPTPVDTAAASPTPLPATPTYGVTPTAISAGTPTGTPGVLPPLTPTAVPTRNQTEPTSTASATPATLPPGPSATATLVTPQPTPEEQTPPRPTRTGPPQDRPLPPITTASTPTPALILPLTGADHTAPSALNLSWKLVIMAGGLALVGFGLRRERRR